ncbi:2-amino-3,7-dideoxy-D-threo-hept-6-ulosonate synthase [subsurface metagenome]|nr:hypothetical protein [Clostridia bacterium]
MIGQIIRLNKLTRKNRNCVVAALDAGEFFGPYQGIVNLASVCKTLNESDAILIEPGAIEICKEAFLGDDPPILITRLNWNSDYCFQWNYNKSQTVKTISPYIALALGADIGIASLSINTQNESNDAKNIKIFSEIIEEAKKVGLPIIGEIYPPLKKYSEE